MRRRAVLTNGGHFSSRRRGRLGRRGTGSTVNVSIIYKQLSNVLVVLTRAVTRSNANSYVTLIKNGVKSHKQITVGLSSGGSTQVVSGLTSGDTVVETVPTARTGTGTGGGGGGPGAAAQVGFRGRTADDQLPERAYLCPWKRTRPVTVGRSRRPRR